MRNFTKTLIRLVPVALLAGTLGACTVTGRAYVPSPSFGVVVYEDPPPPRRVYLAPRPGFIVVEGHWVRHGNRWDWRDGYYERQRADAYWVPGRWERRDRGHVWVDGRWEAHGRVHGDNGRHGGRARVRNH